MVLRPQHPNKELEALLRDLESQGWRVIKGSRYLTALCPCPEKHRKTIHLTPSNPRYLINLRGQLRRATCWKGDIR